MSLRLAILGAGAAGLAAAWALRGSGCAVTVVEKARGVSGRAATRRRAHGGATWRYDHGAQYARPEPGSRAHRLLAEALPADDLVCIEGPVVPFTADGALSEPDRAAEQAPKLTYRDGISHLGKLLHDAGGAALHLETRVAALERGAGGWTLLTEGRGALGPFDAVLVTAPAPQAADLLTASAFDADRRARCVDALREVTYRPQFALALGYDAPVPRPRGAFALVNADRAHPVAWLAFEECKPGHVPRGSLLLAQMSPAWTRAHYAEDGPALVAAARPLLAGLLGGALDAPAWADHHRWRYALPDRAADADALARAADLGLFFAGDGIAGRGRVHLALESGLDAAARVAAAFALRAPETP